MARHILEYGLQYDCVLTLSDCRMNRPERSVGANDAPYQKLLALMSEGMNIRQRFKAVYVIFWTAGFLYTGRPGSNMVQIFLGFNFPTTATVAVLPL